MIDDKGLRANVGIIVINDENQVLFARRSGLDEAWQFPQGGINEGETPVQAMYRELEEELGLLPESVEVLGESQNWLTYYLPKKYRRYHETPMCIGQKQKWFLLRFTGSPSDIKLDTHASPEFDDWAWVKYWYPIRQVITFKQDVYRKALREFSSLVGMDAKQ